MALDLERDAEHAPLLTDGRPQQQRALGARTGQQRNNSGRPAHKRRVSFPRDDDDDDEDDDDDDDDDGDDETRGQARSSLFGRTVAARRWLTLAAALVCATALGVLVGIFSRRWLASSSPSHGGGTKGGTTTPDFTGLPPPKPDQRNPSYLVSGYNGAVATEVDVCSQIGVDVLKDGGTATDAAIASALCIGVTNMFSAGIGGGGFMVITPNVSSDSAALSTCREPIAIDFRETAPAASWPTMFSARADDPDFDGARASRVGGLAVGVPGELRGLEAAYEACGGGVSWARLFEPSVALARELKVGNELGRRLALEWPVGHKMFAWILDHEPWRAVFAPDGDLVKAGDRIHREAYARTLETVARHGADAFYRGEIAESIVKTVQDAGGILTLADLASYEALVGPAVQGTYRNRTLWTSGAPSSGPVLIHLLNVLELYPDFVADGRTGLNTHRFIEALKFAFAARTEFGDPRFVHNHARTDEVATKAYARAVHRNITDDATHALAYYRPHFDIKDDHGTTHVSVVDRHGSSVALTSTVNLLFGSQVMDPDTGVILNDEMDDFATPGIPDAFGLWPSPFNYPQGGKRPLSSTSPVVFSLDDDDDEESGGRLVLGGSGGSRIFGSVAQVMLNLDWGYDLSHAVEEPRAHDQLLPRYVSVESGYRQDLLDALRARGHNLTLFDINVGIAEVQAVVRSPAQRTRLDRHAPNVWAASDSRKNGVAAAY